MSNSKTNTKKVDANVNEETKANVQNNSEIKSKIEKLNEWRKLAKEVNPSLRKIATSKKALSFLTNKEVMADEKEKLEEILKYLSDLEQRLTEKISV
ncbi:MAG: hypothetical protein ACOCZW_06345 [Bacteroidota bacterium]